MCAIPRNVFEFIDEILTFNDYNDIYSVVVPEKSKLLGRKFDLLLRILRKQGILLLAIKKNSAQGKEAHKAKQNSQRRVISNPVGEEEDKPVEPGDRLIVLARKQKDVQDALKNIDG